MNTRADGTHWNWLYRVSGSAGLAAGVLLLVTATSLLGTHPQPGVMNSGFQLLQDNWLATIIKLHAGFAGMPPDPLYGLNPFDLALLSLVGVMHTGLYAELRKTSRIGSIIALVQPFVGIVLFLTTNTAGRCALMGAGLVISVVMLRSNVFGKTVASIGILASILLLAGDISLSLTHSMVIAVLTAGGYILLIAWLFLLARRLYLLGQDEQALAPT